MLKENNEEFERFLKKFKINFEDKRINFEINIEKMEEKLNDNYDDIEIVKIFLEDNIENVEFYMFDIKKYIRGKCAFMDESGSYSCFECENTKICVLVK